MSSLVEIRRNDTSFDNVYSREKLSNSDGKHRIKKRVRMIRGIGTDIVEIARIRKLIEKYGDHFLDKVYTADEIALCSRKALPPIHYAGRWAAKEAFYKALCDEWQVLSSWKSIQVLTDSASGRPFVEVLDTKLNEKFLAERIEKVHLSISHEKTMCTAVVILE